MPQTLCFRQSRGRSKGPPWHQCCCCLTRPRHFIVAYLPSRVPVSGGLFHRPCRCFAIDSYSSESASCLQLRDGARPSSRALYQSRNVCAALLYWHFVQYGLETSDPLPYLTLVVFLRHCFGSGTYGCKGWLPLYMIHAGYLIKRFFIGTTAPTISISFLPAILIRCASTAFCLFLFWLFTMSFSILANILGIGCPTSSAPTRSGPNPQHPPRPPPAFLWRVLSHLSLIHLLSPGRYLPQLPPPLCFSYRLLSRPFLLLTVDPIVSWANQIPLSAGIPLAICRIYGWFAARCTTQNTMDHTFVVAK